MSIKDDYTVQPIKKFECKDWLAVERDVVNADIVDFCADEFEF